MLLSYVLFSNVVLGKETTKEKKRAHELIVLYRRRLKKFSLKILYFSIVSLRETRPDFFLYFSAPNLGFYSLSEEGIKNLKDVLSLLHSSCENLKKTGVK